MKCSSFPLPVLLLLPLLILSLTGPGLAKEEKRACGMGRDYWLYTPDVIDPARTYWLVVGVHGHRGNGAGAAGLAGWVKEYDNVIVVGPSFPSQGPYYQVLEGKSDTQLLDLHKDLGKEFKLHGKMFLHGFSGGAQYAHRFALKHPDRVVGVSAHSGGTWEDKPGSKSRALLWTISCGLQDTAHSAGAPRTRIEYFRQFCRAMLKGDNFTVKPFVTPGGHQRSGEVLTHAAECFRVASTGMFDFQRKATEGMTPMERERAIQKTNRELKSIEFNDGGAAHPINVNEDGWKVSADALKAMEETRKMNERRN